MGLVQYLLLHRVLPGMGWWVPATVLGWSLILLLEFGMRQVVTYLWSVEAYYEASTLNANFLLLGLSVGLCQWLVLRQRLSQAGWWIVANVAGWGFFALITDDTLGQFGLISLSMLPACSTAVALALLLKQVPPPELQSE